MTKQYLVLDIETVPDRQIWTPPEEVPRIKVPKNKATKGDLEFLEHFKTEAPDKVAHEDVEKIRDLARLAGDEDALKLLDECDKEDAPKEKSPFAPIYAHIPICIGGLILDESFETVKVGSIDCRQIEDEPSALIEWSQFMETRAPTLVTWYGRSFDLPVLLLRSLRHGIQTRWFYERDYRYRYSDKNHIDLCDQLSWYGAARGSSLDAIACSIGLPGKHPDKDGQYMDGSEVESVYAGGEGIEKIAAYCQSDCVQTAFVFFRWAHQKGILSDHHHDKAAKSLFGNIPESLAHLKERIDTDRLYLGNRANENHDEKEVPI